MRLAEPRARALLDLARIARLATVDDQGRPHLVPVTFAHHDGRIVIAIDNKPKTSRNLKRLRNIDANPRVSLLADHYEEDWTQLWWVRADGIATILRDTEHTAGPLHLLIAKYPQYRADPPKGPVISIDITAYTAWHA